MLQGQKLLDLYSQVAEETGTTKEQVQNVVSELWSSIREEIANTQGNNILIHHFGSFSIPSKAIPKYIERLTYSYKQGYIDQKKYEKGLKNLEKVQKLLEEKSDDT